MIITSIEEQKNNKNKVSVFIDSVFSFGITKEELISLKLSKNKEISQEELDRIKNYIIFEKAKNRAFKILSFRQYSKLELKNKLSAELFPNDIIDRVIDILENYKYINDFEFTKNYIKNRYITKGYGINKIIFELKRLGINEDDIINAYDETINKFSITEEDKIRELINKKLKGKVYNFEENPKLKQKLFYYLYRRGFNYETIMNALKEN